MDETGKRIEAERPDMAEALRTMNWEQRLKEARARRQALIGGPGPSVKRLVLKRADVTGATTPANNEPTDVEGAPALRTEPALPEVERAEAGPATLSGGGQGPTPIAPEEGEPARRFGFAFKPGLVMAMSLVAGAYVFLALANAPSALGPDEVAARASAPAAGAAPEPAAPSPTISASAPPAVATAPSPDVSVGTAPTVATGIVASGAAGPIDTAPPLSLSLTETAPPDLSARGPAAPAPEVATAEAVARIDTAPPASSALSSALPPDVSAETPGALVAPSAPEGPEVRMAAAALPSAVPVAPSLLDAVAPSRPAEPLSSDIVAAPAAALPVAAAPIGPGPAERPPVVSLLAPAGIAPPAAEIDPATRPVTLPRASGPSTEFSRLSAVTADASPPPAPAGALPAPVLAALDVGFSGASADPGLAPASLPPVGIAAAFAAAPPQPPATPTSPESLANVVIAPPVPIAITPDAADVPSLNEDFLFVRVAVPETVPETTVQELAGLLGGIGIGDGRISRVGFNVSATHIRFYHGSDAEAAAQLGEILGTEVRDHTSFRPSPPDGTIEIFLAGEGSSTPPPRSSAAPQRAQPQPSDELTRMRDRIVNRMRRGEHL